MRTKRFDFNFKPLQINVSMVVVGGVSDSQNYDADTDTYTPDYAIDASNLIVQPEIGRLDKDEVLTPGLINQDLTNINWYEVNSGAADTVIGSTNPDFEIVSKGANAGRIRIKKNAKPQIPMNLRFEADYKDPRTNQVHHIIKPYQVQCKNATTYTPLLVLDAAAQTIYNPLSDPDTQTVHASLRLGVNEF